MTIRLDLDALDDMPTGVVRAPRGPDPAPPPPAPAPAPPTPADEYAIEYDEWDAEPPTHEVVLSPDVLADREATVVAAPPSAPAAAPVDGDAALRAELLSGGRVGRYTILRPLERGAASLLFLAQDEVGGRKVTLGLLRGDHAQTEAGRARLGREAQLLAGLVHPNVVTVHEVGAYAGRIYVAMTPVDGRPLRAWLDLEERRWGAIVEVLVGAGRGLAAAHEVGLVHRDFKASSVLVDEQGEARVVDFGLALADGGGSPATMAPEQLLGHEADPRADQYAFCVVLAEALSGRPPCAGTTVDDRRRELAARVEPDFPGGGDLPPSIRAALLRGLAVDPAARFPTMSELVATLEREVDGGGGARRIDQVRAALARARARVTAEARARPRVFAGVAAGVLVLFVAIFLLTRGGSPAACDGDDPLAALWDQRREAIHGALTATAVPFAEDTWGRVAPRLDAYAAALRAQEAEACAARGRDAAGDAEARRRACLDRRRGAFKALTDALASADDKAALGAMAAAGELPSPAACGDPKALAAADPTPAGPEASAASDELRRRLEAARVDLELGRREPGLTDARELVPAARELGDHRLEAEALAILGGLQRIADDDAAEATLTDAMWAADLARDDERLAEAMAGLLLEIGVDRGRPEEALRARRHAETVIGRLPEGSRGEARLQAALGEVLVAAAQADAGLERLQRALAIIEALDGPEHERVAAALLAVADAQAQRGDLAGARANDARALAITESIFGPEHPRVADALLRLGGVEGRLGDGDAASTHLQRALTIQEAVLGPEHPDLAPVVADIGASIAARGDLAAARPLLERALALEEKARGPEHPALASTLDALGSVARDLGDLAAARKSLERSLAIREKSLPPGDLDLARSYALVGGLDLQDGKLRAARSRLTKALALLEARPTDAGPERLAVARHDLARALRLSGVDAERQAELAALALAGYREVDPERFKDAIAELEAWLAPPAEPTAKATKKKKKKKTKKKTKK